MRFKTDTKEKFHVITLLEFALPATMAAEIEKTLLAYLHNDGEIPRNLVLAMGSVSTIEPAAAKALIDVQQNFYESGASFVLCEMQQGMLDFLEKQELLELMNVTPTQSEAWDIVQMEEIERELFGNEET